MAATHPLPHNKVQETLEAKIHPIQFLWDMRGLAAIVYRGCMAKLFSWTIFIPDFELYPFDRELSYDFE